MTQSVIEKLMTGQPVGCLLTLARGGLWLLSLPYGFIMTLRNLSYDLGLKRVHRVEVPVVAVGNLTTGGTGKTPIVAMLVQQLQQLGHRPGIVSRGYHADETGENDEKRVLRLMCPDVPHEQNPDRVAAARQLIHEHNVTVIVLDDAFQHRRIHRDLNIALIDATNPFGFGHLLPRGLLRESKKGIRRADIVLITRADAEYPQNFGEIDNLATTQKPDLASAIHRVSFKPTEVMTADGKTSALASIHGTRVFAMTAIGNPQAFLEMCREKLGAKIAASKLFPDHHHFTETELESVQREAAETQCSVILTTLKDLVKIPSHFTNINAVLIETVFEGDDGEDAVLAELKKLPLPRATPQ